MKKQQILHLKEKKLSNPMQNGDNLKLGKHFEQNLGPPKMDC